MSDIRIKVADALYELASLSGLAGESPYKTRSYATAASTIKQCPGVDLHNPKSIDGVGDSIAKKIKQIVETGTCPKLEELRDRFFHLLELMKIPGIGPKTALKLYEVHGVTNAKQVDGLIKTGYGMPKSIREGVQAVLSGHDKRITFNEADKIAAPMVRKIEKCKHVGRVVVCGSYRRYKETIGDIDIVVETTKPGKVIAHCSMLLDTVLVDGMKKVSGIKNGVQVDFRFIAPESFGACVLYFTGSKDHNIKMRQMAKDQGFKLNEYGLYKGTDAIAGRTEKDVFDALGMGYVEPEDR